MYLQKESGSVPDPLSYMLLLVSFLSLEPSFLILPTISFYDLFLLLLQLLSTLSDSHNR